MEAEEDDEYDDDQAEFEKLEIESEVDDTSNLQTPNSAKGKEQKVTLKEEDEEYDDDADEFEEDSKDFDESLTSPASDSKGKLAEDTTRKALNREATFEPESDGEKFDDDFEAEDGDDGSVMNSTKSASQLEENPLTKSFNDLAEASASLNDDEEAQKLAVEARVNEELEAIQKAEEEPAQVEAEADLTSILRQGTVEKMQEINAEEENYREKESLEANSKEDEEAREKEEEAARFSAEADEEAARRAAKIKATEEDEREAKESQEEVARLEGETEPDRVVAEVKATKAEARETEEGKEEVDRLAEEAMVEAPQIAAEVEVKEEGEREATEADRVAAEVKTTPEENRETKEQMDDVDRRVEEAEAETPRIASEVEVKEEGEREAKSKEEEAARLEAETESARIATEAEDEAGRIAAELKAKEEKDREALEREDNAARQATETEVETIRRAAEDKAKEEEYREAKEREEKAARLGAEAEAEKVRIAAEVQAKGEEDRKTKASDEEARSSVKARFTEEAPAELLFDDAEADVKIGESRLGTIDEEDDKQEKRWSPGMSRSKLNAGEQGEDEDEDDDPVEKLGGSSGVLQKSSSLPALGLSHAASRRRMPSHLRSPKRKAPRKLPPPTEVQAWDTNHHKTGVENELLPKKLRAYFSRPQSLPELKEDLARRKHMTALRRRLSTEEVPPTKPTAITADSGPPVIPHKHDFGGHMKDRDNQMRPWNNRWSQGINLLNDGMHPSHRQYFSKESLFAEAPSQRWRRYQDVEVTRDYTQGTARWKPIIDKEGRPPRFPPIGF